MNDAEQEEARNAALKILSDFRRHVRAYKIQPSDKSRTAANKLQQPVSNILDECGVSRITQLSAHGTTQAVDVIANWSQNTLFYNGAQRANDAVEIALGIIESGAYPPLPDPSISLVESHAEQPRLQSVDVPVPPPSVSFLQTLDSFVVRATSAWYLATAVIRLALLLRRTHAGALRASIVVVACVVAGVFAWLFLAPSVPEPYQKYSVVGVAVGVAVALSNAVLTQLRP